jgi:gliding motility-associated-like protein
VGCDSIATLNLTINATTTSTTDVTVCPSQLPYNWNGTDYNTAGTYTFTTTNATGCDSIATLNLTINATTTSTTDVAVCPSQLPYSWNGTDYTTAGTYIFTTTNAAGCDSVATLNLTVNSTSTSTTTVAMCSNQLPYSWNGTDYIKAGTYQFTTTNAAGCDSVATLNLTINEPTTSVTDVTVCSNQLPYNWNGTDYNVAGTYTFTTTNAAGCDSVATLNLTINTATTSTTDVAVCSNQLPYNWNGVDYNAAGTYTFTMTNAKGCDSIAILNLSVSKGQHVDTTASACDSFTWDHDGKTYTSSGDYDFIFANGVCADTVTLHLTINKVNFIINDLSAVCAPNAIDLTAPGITAGSDGELNYTYWADSDATVSLSNPGAVTANGTYYIKATSVNGCSAIKPVVVTINAAPNLLVTNPAPVCAPGTIDLTNPTITAGSDPGLGYTYWEDAANTIPVADPKAVGATGTYYITAATTAGCSSTQSVEVLVTVNKATPGVRYPSVATAPNSSTALNARDLGSNYTYSWFPPAGLNFTDIKSPTFNYNQQTQYTITLTPADGGCPTVDTLLVTMRQQNLGCVSKIDVPKAWSPNGDGHNDKLYPLTICIKELKYFRVFNRWGQLVFETRTIGQGWDGIFNGSPQVMDVYTWTLEADGEDGVHYKLAGNSILMR